MGTAMRTWSWHEDEALRRLYPAAPWAEIAEALPGRGRGAVYHRAHKLGLRRELRELSDETRAMFAARAATGTIRRGKHKHPVVSRDGVDGKVCSSCGAWKPLAKYGRQPDMAGGVRAICSTCEGRDAYAKYRERCIAVVRAYQKRHPDEHRMRKRAADRRRHGRAVVGPGVTTAQLRRMIAVYDGKCVYCGADADTIDHVLPLSRGGLHEIDNLVPACSSCNFEKHDKTPMEWFSHRGGIPCRAS
jgi:5-methylcytosine-specific restriction endonuclease McrA